MGLASMDKANGGSDPFVTVKLGTQALGSSDTHLSDTSEPYFGQVGSKPTKHICAHCMYNLF